MIDANNPEIYFFQACIHSLNEETDSAFELLEKSIALGLSDKDSILTEGHLAFIRITNRYEDFKAKFLAQTVKMDLVVFIE